MKALRKLRAEDTHLELVDVTRPSPGPAGWCSTYAGICGTDVHIKALIDPSAERSGTVQFVDPNKFPRGDQLNRYLNAHPHWANTLLVASSALIDGL